MKTKIKKLIEKGVRIDAPESIEIGKEVDIENISEKNVRIYAGSKIFGEKTLISENVTIGYEAPQTIVNSQIGLNVSLSGGFCKDSVFLNNVKVGSGSHIREGSILEEEVKIAHTVGLKQTILFPFVTLGSLINFCDCFMAGGKDSKNHSEVGSSYIHFNFTPYQDKATASLIGNVYEGVMLDKNPIFLGGQGGLVGPALIPFGTTIAAGTIQRKDEIEENMLLFGEKFSERKIKNVSYTPNIESVTKKNLLYISNLFALKNWYIFVRSNFFTSSFKKKLFTDGLLEKLTININERIKQLENLYRKSDKNFLNVSKEIEKKENFEGNVDLRDSFLKTINTKKSYINWIKSLSEEDKKKGVLWLKSIVQN